jgi:hypothetical protein
MSTKTFICDGCGCEFRDTSSNPQKSFEDRVLHVCSSDCAEFLSNKIGSRADLDLYLRLNF